MLHTQILFDNLTSKVMRPDFFIWQYCSGGIYSLVDHLLYTIVKYQIVPPGPSLITCTPATGQCVPCVLVPHAYSGLLQKAVLRQVDLERDKAGSPKCQELCPEEGEEGFAMRRKLHNTNE